MKLLLHFRVMRCKLKQVVQMVYCHGILFIIFIFGLLIHNILSALWTSIFFLWVSSCFRKSITWFITWCCYCNKGNLNHKKRTQLIRHSSSSIMNYSGFSVNWGKIPRYRQLKAMLAIFCQMQAICLISVRYFFSVHIPIKRQSNSYTF